MDSETAEEEPNKANEANNKKPSKHNQKRNEVLT